MAVAPEAAQNTLFNEVQAFFHNAVVDLKHFRKIAERNDEDREKEIEEIRKKVESERYDSREEISQFRYANDALVHRKVERVVEATEDMQRAQKKDDVLQQEQIDGVGKDLMKLKIDLWNVSTQWRKFWRPAL